MQDSAGPNLGQYIASSYIVKAALWLLNKYSAYQKDYENPSKDWKTGKAFDAKGNPLLYDALLTGCKLPFATSSFSEYSTEIEADIKTIVKLTPQSLFSIDCTGIFFNKDAESP